MCARLPVRCVLRLHVRVRVDSMLLWVWPCVGQVSAVVCTVAATQCGWEGPVLKLCVGGRDREKIASSIACLALLFSCRIVRILIFWNTGR